jgi:hypothetical protein
MFATREAVVALSTKELNAVCAMGKYNHRAILLEIQFHHAWEAMENAPKHEHQAIFEQFVNPYYELWVSSVYVVHEGLLELDVQDTKLSALRNKVDFRLMRRFRNATFHFQPEYRPKKQQEFVLAQVPRETGMTGWVHRLHDRHGIIVRKLLRYVKYNPHAAGVPGRD